MAEWISSISGALAVGVGIVALWYARGQVEDAVAAQKQAKNSAFGQFLLQLDEAFQRHNTVHLHLRNRGEWQKDSNNRPTDAELPAAEAYMGLFERVMVMIDLGLLEPKVVEHLYGYRVNNIWANNRIMDVKLAQYPEGWSKFLRLIKTMEKARGSPYIKDRWQKYDELCREHDRRRREREGRYA